MTGKKHLKNNTILTLFEKRWHLTRNSDDAGKKVKKTFGDASVKQHDAMRRDKKKYMSAQLCMKVAEDL